MKRFAVVLAFATMVPAVASAEGAALKPISQMQPWASVSGEVKTELLMCAGFLPCPPKVTIGRTTINGPLAEDLAAFKGKQVTVLGTKDPFGALTATGFAQGSTKNFVTGTVINTNVCAANERCLPHWAIQMGDYKISINDNDTLNKVLPALAGATITLRGKTTPFTCPVGAMCARLDSGTFAWDSGTDIRVKGDYVNNHFGLNGEIGRITFPGGGSLPVEGNVMNANGPVWITGKIGTDPISKQPVLKSTSATPVTHYGFPLPNGGMNVGRGADTNGATNAAAADTQNAGFAH